MSARRWGAPHWPLAIAAVTVAAAAPLAIPYGRFIGDPARARHACSAPGLDGQRPLPRRVGSADGGLVCAGLGALVLLVPRRAAVALPLIVLAWFALLVQPVFAGPHGFKRSSQGAVFQGIRGVDRGLDRRRRADGGGRLRALDGPLVSDRFTVNQNEFFNRPSGRSTTRRGPRPVRINERRIHFDRLGLRTHRRRPSRPGALPPDGRRSHPRRRADRVRRDRRVALASARAACSRRPRFGASTRTRGRASRSSGRGVAAAPAS